MLQLHAIYSFSLLSFLICVRLAMTGDKRRSSFRFLFQEDNRHDSHSKRSPLGGSGRASAGGSGSPRGGREAAAALPGVEKGNIK